MSAIYLVRHGQASFGRSNYDQLCARGEKQAEIVGHAMRERGINPSLMVTGTLGRQRSTAVRMWDAGDWDASVEVDDGWNEFDHLSVVSAFKPAWRNPAIMRADVARHRHPRAAFAEVFDQACAKWASTDSEMEAATNEYAETFAEFTNRVSLALGRVTSSLNQGESAVIVTSAGTMAVVAASLLTAEPSRLRGAQTLPSSTSSIMGTTWLNVCRTTVNTGITTVLAGASLTVLTTNDHAHLGGDRELITYR